MKFLMKTVALALIALLCLSAVAALADSQVTTTGAVHLRRGPSLDYRSICTVPEGRTLTCDQTAVDERGVAWYHVTYNGNPGWISSKYAKTGGGSTYNEKVTTTANLKLRTGAGTLYEVLTVIDSGTTLTYDATGYDASNVLWYRVSYRGMTGWISSRYTRKGSGASGQVTTTGNVHLRAGAGLDYGSYDTVASGTTLSYDKTAVDSRGVTWYHVTYKGRAGWVSSMYTRQGGGGSTPTQGSTVTTTGKVHLRTGAGLSYTAIGSVPSGVTLAYDNTAKDDRGVTWYHVRYNGNPGWISSKYAKAGGGSAGSGDRVTLTGSANIRSGPGLDYASIGTAEKGTSLTYRGKSQKDSRGVAWYAVSYRGENGWVSSKYARIK